MEAIEKVVEDALKTVIDSAQSIESSTDPQRVYNRNEEKLRNIVAIYGAGVAYTEQYQTAEDAHTASIIATLRI